MVKRSYTTGVMMALAYICGGTCFWPGCRVPVHIYVDGNPVFNLQVAHICAASPDGPRYEPSMTDQERNGYTNVLLLCQGHHIEVDILNPDKYSVELLKRWKVDRENDAGRDANTLDSITEERFQYLMADALSEQEERILSAIQRLEEVDQESAANVRRLLEEVVAMRTDDAGQYLEAASIFGDAVSKLGSSGQLLEAATQLNYAADKLDSGSQFM